MEAIFHHTYAKNIKPSCAAKFRALIQGLQSQWSAADVPHKLHEKTAGWWLSLPLWKMEFVSWDDDIANIWKKTCSKPPLFFPRFRTVRMLSSKPPTRQCQMFVLHLANSFMLSSRTKTRLGETHFCRWWNPNASTSSSGSGSDTW